MAQTSDPSTPPGSTSPTSSGAGSTGDPGTPGQDTAVPPDTEAGMATASSTVGDLTLEEGEDAGTDESDPSLDGEDAPSTEDDDGDADRTKNTIGNIR